MSVVGAVYIQSKRGKASELDVTDDISDSGPQTGPWKSGPRTEPKNYLQKIRTPDQIKKIRIPHRRSGYLRLRSTMNRFRLILNESYNMSHIPSARQIGFNFRASIGSTTYAILIFKA